MIGNLGRVNKDDWTVGKKHGGLVVFLVISGALPAPPTQHSGSSARGLREKALPFVPRKALLELWRRKQQVSCSRRAARGGHGEMFRDASTE